MRDFTYSRREIADLLCSQTDRTWGGLSITERDALMEAAEIAVRARDKVFDRYAAMIGPAVRNAHYASLAAGLTKVGLSQAEIDTLVQACLDTGSDAPIIACMRQKLGMPT
jgi:hypothetical protein